jgi:hypothetical protein
MAQDKTQDGGKDKTSESTPDVDLMDNENVQSAWEDHMKDEDPNYEPEDGDDDQDLDDSDSDQDTDDSDDDSTDDTSEDDDDSDSTVDDEGEDEDGGTTDELDDEGDETPDGSLDDEDDSEDPDAVHTETLKYTAAKKKKEFEIATDKDGRLTPRSRTALERKLATTGIEDTHQAKMQEHAEYVKTTDGRILELETQLDEVVRASNKQAELDKPIEHLLKLVRHEPRVRAAIEGHQDAEFKGLLAKHGFDPAKPTHEYDYNKAEETLGVQQEALVKFQREVKTETDKIVDEYATENNLSPEDMKKLIKYGRDNFDFNARIDANGTLLPVEKQAEWFKFQLENAHGRALKFGELETPTHRKTKDELDQEKKLKDREKTRQKKRNRKFKSTGGAPGKGSTAGKRKPGEIVDVEDTDDFLLNNPRVQKQAKKAGITRR